MRILATAWRSGNADKSWTVAKPRTPQQIVAEGADARFLNEVKQEPKG